jgi:glycine cleavage system H protein
MTRYFTKDHEWLEIEGNTATVGITDFAQNALGDITFVEVPETGKTFAKGDTAAVVDSVKAASDVYAPVSGDVTEANAALDGEPELVNTSPETEGWLWRQTVADAADLAELMDEAAYKAFIAEL